MGRHIIVVTEYGQRMVRQGDYVFSHFYDFSLVFVKLAILAFYWRIFVQPVFRAVVCATAAFVVCWGIGITVTLLLACRPLRAYWDVAVPGHCLKIVMFTYFTNISNLVTDVWIFLMPIPMIWFLQLQTKRKMMLILIFCIGLAYVHNNDMSFLNILTCDSLQCLRHIRPSIDHHPRPRKP